MWFLLPSPTEKEILRPSLEKLSRKLAKCSHVHTLIHTFTVDSRAWIWSSLTMNLALKVHKVSHSQKCEHRVKYHRITLFYCFPFGREACLTYAQDPSVLRTFRNWWIEDMVLLAVVFHFRHSKSFSLYIWNRSLIVLYLGNWTCDPSAAWLFIMTYGHFPLPFNSYVVGNKLKPSPPCLYLFLPLKRFRVCWVQKE